MINELKKIENLCKQNEKRICNIENKILKYVNNQKAEYKANFLIANQNLISKTFKFLSENGEGCVVSLSLDGTESSNADINLYLNGESLATKNITLPFEVELAVLPQKGENLFLVEIVPATYSSSFKMQVKVDGCLNNETIERHLGIINENLVYFQNGDGFHIVNTQTQTCVYAEYKIRIAKAVEVSDGICVIVLYENGNKSIFKLDKNTYSKQNILNLPSSFTDCAVKPVDGGVMVYLLVNGNVISYLYTDKITQIEKLSIHAKKIDFFRGQNSDYFYYTDIRDNVSVLKIVDSTTFSSTGGYALGKKKNLIIGEYEDKLKIFYSSGEIVVMRSIDNLSDAVALGKGVLGVKSTNGKTIILGDEFIIN